ncbi:MAG: cell division protein FtsA [Lachnospiraceae bacterium]|nr:cell division protein FtsA [Lachnospiraceae bacterium]
MGELTTYPGALVFGLDIGTRSVVGTVGYRKGDMFYVIAQALKEHETRAMLDGQIHDIGKVAATIKEVKEILESKIDRKLNEVCIAAAGRVLRTENASVEIAFEKEEVVTDAMIYELDALGVERAYEKFVANKSGDERFYCVGHSVIRYYMNDTIISNLENHKAHKIGMDLIATFLPSEVIDGLYAAVELADLKVANLTLEPIAAMEVAVPEKFRMLNIALVDVGAGTSDICITRDGSIAAYGMIPEAGDCLTDIITQQCLVEFAVAEKIKKGIGEADKVTFEDIMGLEQIITKSEVLSLLEPMIDTMTQNVADMILSLNADKPVSAVFVVGGGGRVEGYTSKLAEKLGIPVQRVALRGEDVMQKISFPEDALQRDSMLVTPLGICLNFFEQSHSFIFVNFNGERVKLYDNGKLCIVDAVMQSGLSNEDLFPKRGRALNFILNGKTKTVRGELGEAAEVYLNEAIADLHTLVAANDNIRVHVSTVGADASAILSKVADLTESIMVEVNGKTVSFPKLATVNAEFVASTYEIKENDIVELLDYYTVEQILEFLDVLPQDVSVYEVNNKKADLQTKVYDKFSFLFRTGNDKNAVSEDLEQEEDEAEDDLLNEADSDTDQKEPETQEAQTRNVAVIVNDAPVVLSGRMNYIFVDVFDFIDFDLSQSNGRFIATRLNGEPAQYAQEIQEGDVIEIFWKE